MDIEMPVMNGIKASKKIRDLINKNLIPKIPIVALTAYIDEKEKCLNAGMVEFSKYFLLIL